MPEPSSPLQRSIGLSGAIRFALAVFAILAVGAALTAHRLLLGITAAVFFTLAAFAGYRAWRARTDLTKRV